MRRELLPAGLRRTARRRTVRRVDPAVRGRHGHPDPVRQREGLPRRAYRVQARPQWPERYRAGNLRHGFDRSRVGLLGVDRGRLRYRPGWWSRPGHAGHGRVPVVGRWHLLRGRPLPILRRGRRGHRAGLCGGGRSPPERGQPAGRDHGRAGAGRRHAGRGRLCRDSRHGDADRRCGRDRGPAPGVRDRVAATGEPRPRCSEAQHRPRRRGGRCRGLGQGRVGRGAWRRPTHFAFPIPRARPGAGRLPVPAQRRAGALVVVSADRGRQRARPRRQQRPRRRRTSGAEPERAGIAKASGRRLVGP